MSRTPHTTVIVRSCNERTLPACLAALRPQIPETSLFIVEERPFSAAVRRTLEIGERQFSRGLARWVIALDADILLTPSAVSTLVGLCESADPAAYKMNGVVLCKFFGGFCFRGVHAYRASLLRRALDHVGADTATLRPETAVAEAMQREGHPIAVFPKPPLGVHDFEQSFRHIYLKMLLRARKTDEERTWLRERFEQFAEHDDDFKAALWGFDDGLTDQTILGDRAPREYDWLARYPVFERRMHAAGLTEKRELDPAEGPSYAQRAIDAHDAASDLYTPPWIRKALNIAAIPKRPTLTPTAAA